jgi:hypothetical protein
MHCPDSALCAGAAGAFEALATLLRVAARQRAHASAMLQGHALLAVDALLTGLGMEANEARALRAGILQLIPRNNQQNMDLHARLSRAAATEAEAAAASLLAEEAAEHAAKAAPLPHGRRNRKKKSSSSGGGGGAGISAAGAAFADEEEPESRVTDADDAAPCAPPAASAAAERRRRRAAAKAASRGVGTVGLGVESVDEVAPPSPPDQPADADAGANADAGASGMLEAALADLPPRAHSPPPAAPAATDEPAAPVGASEPPAEPAPAAAAAAAEEPAAEAAARLTGVCAVCMDAPLEGVFMLCGHVAACVACGERVMSQRAVCPICEQPAVHFARLFLCSAQT